MLNKRNLIAACYLLVLFLLTFQNCAKVQFHERASYEAGQPEASPLNDTIEPLTQGPTNGEGFDGKVSHYMHFSQPGECGSDISVIQDVIEKQGLETYYIIYENCGEIPARRLDETLVVENKGGVQYQGRSYVLDYPASCLDIYNHGGDNPNGLYTILPAGASEPQLEYCNMDFVALGWSHWGDWSECDSTCGIGEQSRARICQSGNCSGDSEQVRSCERAPCP